MGLKNVSLCRCYAVMPHMCHYADFDAGIKGQPQAKSPLATLFEKKIERLPDVIGRTASGDVTSGRSTRLRAQRLPLATVLSLMVMTMLTTLFRVRRS